MGDNTKPKTWVDTLAKLLPGIGALVAGVLIPLVLSANAESSRKFQLYTEILSQREMADSDLRAKMFERLTTYYYGQSVDSLNTTQKLTLLRLLALNFHECFDMKPLFESLELELDSTGLKVLHEIINEVKSKQEALLSHVKQGLKCTRTMGEGDAVMVPPDADSAYRGHRLGIEVLKLGDGYARMRVVDVVDTLDAIDVEFNLDLYDLPFTDNTKLSNDTRFALMLDELGWQDTDGDGTMEDRAARIKIIFFPESYMSSRDRPFLDEMLEQLKHGAEG